MKLRRPQLPLVLNKAENKAPSFAKTGRVANGLSPSVDVVSNGDFSSVTTVRPRLGLGDIEPTEPNVEAAVPFLFIAMAVLGGLPSFCGGFAVGENDGLIEAFP